MAPAEDDQHTHSAFHALGYVLAHIQTQPVVTLFLSTNYVLQPIAPASQLHPSALEKTTSLAPYTELPFDVFSRGLCSLLKHEGKRTLDSVCRMEQIVRFGRPLYLFSSSSLSQLQLISRWYSQYHFRGAELSPRDFTEHSTSQFAALDSRILLALMSANPLLESLLHTWSQPTCEQSTMCRGIKDTCDQGTHQSWC